MSTFCLYTLSLDRYRCFCTPCLIFTCIVLLSSIHIRLNEIRLQLFTGVYGIYSVMIWDDMDVTIRHCHSAYQCDSSTSNAELRSISLQSTLSLSVSDGEVNTVPFPPNR